MRTLNRWIPAWLSAPARRLPTQGCVYLSPSTVALARPDDTATRVLLCADRVTRDDDVSVVLRRQLERVNGCRAKTLVLSPELYSLSLIERPTVSDEDLCEAVRWKLQESVDFPVDEATLDVFALPEAATRGRPMVFVAAARTDTLRGILDKLRKTGLELESVDIAELGLRNLAYRLYDEPDQTIGLLRMTTASGMINITRAHALFLARRLAGLPTAFDAAEWDDLKDRILLQVQRSIDYYESALQQPPCQALLVAASEGWEQRLVAHLQEMLPLPVRPLAAELAGALELTLFNPDPQPVDWNQLSIEQGSALTAALPALGGVLAVPEEAA